LAQVRSPLSGTCPCSSMRCAVVFALGAARAQDADADAAAAADSPPDVQLIGTGSTLIEFTTSDTKFANVSYCGDDSDLPFTLKKVLSGSSADPEDGACALLFGSPYQWVVSTAGGDPVVSLGCGDQEATMEAAEVAPVQDAENKTCPGVAVVEDMRVRCEVATEGTVVGFSLSDTAADDIEVEGSTVRFADNTDKTLFVQVQAKDGCSDGCDCSAASVVCSSPDPFSPWNVVGRSSILWRSAGSDSQITIGSEHTFSEGSTTMLEPCQNKDRADAIWAPGGEKFALLSLSPSWAHVKLPQRVELVEAALALGSLVTRPEMETSAEYMLSFLVTAGGKTDVLELKKPTGTSLQVKIDDSSKLVVTAYERSTAEVTCTSNDALSASEAVEVVVMVAKKLLTVHIGSVMQTACTLAVAEPMPGSASVTPLLGNGDTNAGTSVSSVAYQPLFMSYAPAAAELNPNDPLVGYLDAGSGDESCGPDGDDFNFCQAGGCEITVSKQVCSSGIAEFVENIQRNVTVDSCKYGAFSRYECVDGDSWLCNDKQAGGTADMVIVLDKSGSMRWTRNGDTGWNTATRFLEDLANKITIGPRAIRVAVVFYSSSWRTEVKFPFSSPQLSSSIASLFAHARRNVIPSGGTHTHTGLDVAGQLLANSDADSRIALLVTDGYSSSSSRTLQSAQKLKDSGIKVVGVGMLRPKFQEVMDLSTKGMHFFVNVSQADVDRHNAQSGADPASLIVSNPDALVSNLTGSICNVLDPCFEKSAAELCNGNGVLGAAGRTCICVCNQGFAGADCGMCTDSSGPKENFTIQVRNKTFPGVLPLEGWTGTETGDEVDPSVSYAFHMAVDDNCNVGSPQCPSVYKRVNCRETTCTFLGAAEISREVCDCVAPADQETNCEEAITKDPTAWSAKPGCDDAGVSDRCCSSCSAVNPASPMFAVKFKVQDGNQRNADGARVWFRQGAFPVEYPLGFEACPGAQVVLRGTSFSISVSLDGSNTTTLKSVDISYEATAETQIQWENAAEGEEHKLFVEVSPSTDVGAYNATRASVACPSSNGTDEDVLAEFTSGTAAWSLLAVAAALVSRWA